jgi:hypothetical protein
MSITFVPKFATKSNNFNYILLLFVDKEIWKISIKILAFRNNVILCIFCTGTYNRITNCNSRKLNFVKFQFAEY